jgi:hypothetical protein
MGESDWKLIRLPNSDHEVERVAAFAHSLRKMLAAYLSYAVDDLSSIDESSAALLLEVIRSLEYDEPLGVTPAGRRDVRHKQRKDHRSSGVRLKAAESIAERSLTASENVADVKLATLLTEVGDISSIEIRDAAIFGQAVERLAKIARVADQVLTERRASLRNIAALEKQINRTQAETSRTLHLLTSGRANDER